MTECRFLDSVVDLCKPFLFNLSLVDWNVAQLGVLQAFKEFLVSSLLCCYCAFLVIGDNFDKVHF